MASLQRNFYENGIYHVFNRGNHRERIFHHSEDYLQFLCTMRRYAKRENIEVLGYCLMANHYHLLLKLGNEADLTQMMRSLGSSFAQYHNRQHEQVGHLWQGRFGARVIRDSADLINVSAYIHRNPAEFTDFMTYRWSDVARHTGDHLTAFLELAGLSPSQYQRYVCHEIKKLVAQPPSGGVATALR